VIRPGLVFAALPVTAIPMLDDGTLLGIPVGQATPAGLLGVFIVLIGLGRLVPRRTLDDAYKDRDGWRDAHTTSEKARVEMQATLDQILSAVTLILQALPQGVERAREDKERPS